MNKKSMIKLGVVSSLILLSFVVLFLISGGFAQIEKTEYVLGEKVKLDLTGYINYKLKIITPSTSYLKEGSNDVFIFSPEEIGNYSIEINSNGKKELYNFRVFEEGSDTTENVIDEGESIINSVKNFFSGEEDKEVFNIEFNDLESVNNKKFFVSDKIKFNLRNFGNYEVLITSKNNKLSRVGGGDFFIFELNEPGIYQIDFIYGGGIYKYSFEVFDLNNLSIPLQNIAEINKLVEWSFVTENKTIDATNFINFSLIDFDSGNAINFSLIEENGTKIIQIDPLFEGRVEINYITEPPKVIENEISKDFKEVIVYSPDEIHYTNVLAYTSIDENLKIISQDSLRVYWKEEDKYLDFDVFDSDNNSFFDKIEWIVPHLSNQTFNIIVITKAEHLDENREFIEDVYSSVQYKDDSFIEILSGHYLRVTFESNLTSDKDITIYAKGSSNSTIEVYEKDSNVKIADFGNVYLEDWYKIFLTGLTGTQDAFDLLVLGGNIFFDYVIDPLFYTLIEYQGWEAGDGSWTDGGGDSDRSNVRSLCLDNGNLGGSWSWHLQDNSGSGSADKSFDFTNYDNVTVNFSAFYTSIEGAEDLLFQCDGTTLWSYQAGTQGTEDQWLNGSASNQSLTIYPANCTFDSSVNLAFIASFSANDDDVYIDCLNITAQEFNFPPINSTPNINSSLGGNGSSDNLNCYKTLIDSDGDSMNVSVIWYKNGTQNLTLSYNNSYSNNTNFVSTLLSGNLSSGQNWSCSMRLADKYQVSNYINSTNLTIISTPVFNITRISPLNQTYNSSSVYANVSLNNVGTGCVYSLDGTSNRTMNSINSTYYSSLLTYIREGMHNITITCNDSYGQSNNTNVNFSVSISAPVFYVQRSNTTIVSGSNQTNVSVNFSDPSKVFTVSSFRTSAAAPSEGQVASYVYNNASVSFSKYGTTTNNFVEWEVVESDSFYVQRGQIDYGTTNTSIVVNLNTSINTSSSFAIVTNKLNSATNGNNAYGFWTVRIINSSAIILQRGSSPNSAGTVSWQVVEWSGSNVLSGNTSLFSVLSNISNLASSVNTSKSFLVLSNRIDSGTQQDEIFIQGNLSSTQLNFTRIDSTGTNNVEWFVVQNSRLRVQSDYFPLATASTPQIDNFTTSVNSTYTFTVDSHKNAGAGTTFSNSWITRNLSSSNNITFTKGTASNAGNTTWFVVEYITNQAPTHSIPILNSSSNGNTTVENLTVYPQLVSDSDGDSVKRIISWHSNSNPVTILNMPFEGGSNSSFTRDYSSVANNGSVSGAIFNSSGGYDGKGAYQFDGIDDIISINSVINGTVVMWIKNSTGWFHLANATGTTYINGQSASVTLPFNRSAIGRYLNGTFFNGTIDEVLIFNRTLSQAQINALYNNRTDLITHDETITNDIWYACVIPNDGIIDGVQLCSNTLTILGQQINLSITTNASSYIQGDIARISVNSTSSGSPIQVNTTSYIIEGSTSDIWWNTSWGYRIPIIINSTTQNRTDSIITKTINFTEVLRNQLNITNLRFDNNSVRIVEYSNNQHLFINSQFDPATGYNNLTNATGDVVWLINGTISPNTQKYYYIYFDTNQSSKTAPTYANMNSSNLGSVIQINSTLYDGSRMVIHVENDSDGGQADRESFISFIGINGYDYTNVTGGMDGISLIDTTNGGAQYDIDLFYNSTLISGPLHTRILLNIVPDSTTTIVGNVYLDFYPTRYFKLTTINKNFDITQLGWINPDSTNNGAYEDSSTGVTIVTADASFTSEGRWVANEVNNNLTIIIWNLTNSSQTNSSQINFDTGGTDLLSWNGDSDDVNLDLYFAVLNTTDFNQSANFVRAIFNPVSITQNFSQRFVSTNNYLTNSSGIANFTFNTTSQNPNIYSVVTNATKTDYQNGYGSTTFILNAQVAAQTPIVILTSPSNNTIQNSSLINLSYNTSDINNNILNSTLILNSQLNQTNQSVIANNGINNFTMTLADGNYTWTVNVTDSTLLTGTNSSIRYFTIDSRAPNITLFSPNASQNVSSNSVLFNFSASDNLDSILVCDLIVDSVVLENDFNINNNSFVNYTETISVGTHFWNVSCVDNAGSVNFSATRNFTVTDSPPVVLLITGNNSYTTTGNITLQYNASDNNNLSSSRLILNGQLNLTNQSVINNSGINNFSLINLVEGIYTWTVNVTDNTGNNATNSSIRTFIVDRNTPNISLNLPTNLSVFNSSTVDFNFSVNDSIDGSMLCNLSVGNNQSLNFAATNNTLKNVQISGLTDGQKTWNVTCYDDAGNFNISQNRLVNITVYPLITLNTQNNSFFNYSNISLSYTSLDNTNLSSCSLFVDGVFNQTNQSAVLNGQTNSFNLTIASQGTHIWYVGCNDTINLTNQSETRIFTIDLDGLNITLLSPFNNSELFVDTLNFSYNVTDNIDTTLNCNITVNSLVVDSYSATSGAITNRSVFFSDGGLKLWNVTCIDDSNNIMISETRNFTLAFAPIVSLTNPSSGTIQNTASINLFYQASDDNNNIVNSTLVLNGQLNQTNQSVILNETENNFTVILLDGFYNWTVNVTDSTGLKGTDNVTRNFTIDTNSPNITLFNPTNNENVTWNNFTFNFSVYDNLDTNISCNLSINGILDSSFNISNGSNKVYNDTLPDGNYSWNVSCIDNALNIGYSLTLNFSVDAPPNVTLGNPVNNSYQNITSTVFYYTPLDPIDFANCSLILDGVLNNTESLISNNLENSISAIGGLNQGNHNWTVSCVDIDNNTYTPSLRFFITDSIFPLIILNSPLNNSNTLRTVDFNFTSLDNIDINVSCNLYIDGTINISNINATNNSQITRTIGNISLGQHNWNVTCFDDALNLNWSDKLFFNVTLPDLMVNSSSIGFNTTSPSENDSVRINSTIYNLGNVTVYNVTVQFFDGDPDSGGTQIGNNQTIGSILSLSQQVINITWFADLGTSNIFVIVDPIISSNGSIQEFNETNNRINNSIITGSWQFVYGNINSGSRFELADNFNSNVISWEDVDFNSGNIYVTDSEASVSWFELQALYKNISGGNATNDFDDLDSLLGMTNFSDSVRKLYVNNSGVLFNTTSLIVFGDLISLIPITNSTNNTNFVTGILWDFDDDSNGEFSIADSEDIIFVTPLNEDTSGAYGVYDYELRIPAKLREYDNSDPYSVIFYTEIY